MGGNQAQGAALSKSEVGANAAAGSSDNASASQDDSQRALRAAEFPWHGFLSQHVIAAVKCSKVSSRQLVRITLPCIVPLAEQLKLGVSWSGRYAW